MRTKRFTEQLGSFQFTFRQWTRGALGTICIKITLSRCGSIKARHVNAQKVPLSGEKDPDRWRLDGGCGRPRTRKKRVSRIKGTTCWLVDSILLGFSLARRESRGSEARRDEESEKRLKGWGGWIPSNLFSTRDNLASLLRFNPPSSLSTPFARSPFRLARLQPRLGNHPPTLSPSLSGVKSTSELNHCWISGKVAVAGRKEERKEGRKEGRKPSSD